MSFRFHRRPLSLPTLAAVLALSTTPLLAKVEQARVFSFDIPAESLADALVAVANRTNLNIFVDRKLVGDRQAPALQEQLTADQALTRLLAGTGLKYHFLNESTVVLATDVPQMLQKGVIDLDEVVVTGSRIPLTASQQAQPVEVYTRADMERSGQTTVADFLNNLPQVSIPSIGNAFASYGSQRGVRLHGLPFGTTLVLIDGQRTEGGYYGSFDLSSIPAAAIERIEIIPVGSSAVYGSDALAGVVNLVMKKNFDGIAVDARYAGASGLRDGTVDAAYGHNWDRGSVSLIVSDQRQTELSMSERAITATGNFTTYGGKNYAVDSCAPANVYAPGGQVLSNGGQVRQCGPYRAESLLPATGQLSAVLSAHYEITPWLDAFTSVLYSHFVEDSYNNNLLTLSGGSTGTYVASAANPYNPYGQNVGVSWGYGKADSRRVEDMERPLFGLRGELPGNWHWELTGLYAHDGFNFPTYGTNAAAVRTALASSNPATALNVFGGSPGSPQLLNSLFTRYFQRFDETLTEAQAIVRGPAVSLPAGPLQTVVGLTYDHSRIWDELSSSSALVPATARSRDAYAAFAEARAPILASESRSTGKEVLTLSFAGRYDHSGDFGGKSTWQTGLEFRPVESLLFRGAYGTAYRAPQLAEVYGGTFVTSSAPISDPLRGGAAYFVPFTETTDTHLKPETGSSTSAGLVYSSTALTGLESSLTWWNIKYNNYITVVNYQDAVTYPGSFPSGIVTRAAPTADDIAKGYAGVITGINSPYVNYGSIQVSGVDFESHYAIRTRWGTWTPSVALTQTYQYEVALRPGQPEQSYVSQASTTLGFSPRWKGNASLSWEQGPWSTNLTGRFVGSYKDYASYAPAGYELGDFWLFDTNVRYRLGALFGAGSALKDSYVSVGAVNLFDRKPQFSYYFLGYDFQEADIRERFVYLQAGVRF